MKRSPKKIAGFWRGGAIVESFRLFLARGGRPIRTPEGQNRHCTGQKLELLPWDASAAELKYYKGVAKQRYYVHV